MRIEYPDGISMNLVDQGDMVVHLINRNGYFEPEVRKEWDVILQTATHVLDIGAYTGLYAIAAELRGVSATAFEPHPGVFQRLLLNLKANGVEAQVAQVALGCPEHGHSRSVFSVNSRTPFSSGGAIMNASHVVPNASRNENILVDVYSLDALLPGCQYDAMKIDVEGAELDVLRGAEGSIMANRPKIIAELLTSAAETEVGKWFAERDYTGRKLDATNWLFTGRTENSHV